MSGHTPNPLKLQMRKNTQANTRAMKKSMEKKVEGKIIASVHGAEYTWCPAIYNIIYKENANTLQL